MTRVSVVVLAYLDEPWVERCVDSLLGSVGVEVDVVLVDNGCTTGAVDRIEGRPGVTVVRPGRNTGYAGGCNLGAAHAAGEVLALVNADAVVEPDALARLAAVACEPGVGIASGSIRLADRPWLMNSAGNPLHVSGLSWAGGFEDPVSDHSERRRVLGASGAGLALRRSLWEELGGFYEPYFAYLEDTELSLRCWHRGLEVVFVPDAVVLHRYEFSRNPGKMHLLERNRLLLVATTYEARTLWVLLPVLLVVELAVSVLAVVQGWPGGKARAWWWLLRHAGRVRARRVVLQAERRVGDAAILPHLSTRLAEQSAMSVPGLPLLDAAVTAYWRFAVRRSRVSTLR